MTVADGYSSAKSLQTLACSKGLTRGRVKNEGVGGVYIAHIPVPVPISRTCWGSDLIGARKRLLSSSIVNI